VSTGIGAQTIDQNLRACHSPNVVARMLQGKDHDNATAIQEITRQLAELVYGGRRGVRHKGWAPADVETIRCRPP
jgi:hypothetical protein